MNRQLATIYVSSAMLVFQLCAPVMAETISNTDGVDPFSGLNSQPGEVTNTNPTAQTESVNGNEASVLQNTVYNRSGPVNKDGQMPHVDVSNKYGQAGAAGTAQEGKIVATATGVSLIATGTPMAASILAPVRAAGINLIAKGVMELAQAAADAGAEAGNRAIEKDLRKPDPGEMAAMQEAAKAQARENLVSQLSQPNVMGALGNGVTPEYLADQMLTGQYTTPESVGRLMGQDYDFSPEDLAAAAQIEAKYANGEMADAKLAFDDSNEEKTVGGGGSVGLGNMEGDGRVGAAGSIAGGEMGEGQAINGGSRQLASRGVNGKGAAGEAIAANGLLSDMWKRFGEMNQAQLMRGPLAALTREELHALGLVRAELGPNIFTKARRNYRQFGDWRARR